MIFLPSNDWSAADLFVSAMEGLDLEGFPEEDKQRMVKMIETAQMRDR